MRILTNSVRLHDELLAGPKEVISRNTPGALQRQSPSPLSKQTEPSPQADDDLLAFLPASAAGESAFPTPLLPSE